MATEDPVIPDIFGEDPSHKKNRWKQESPPEGLQPLYKLHPRSEVEDQINKILHDYEVPKDREPELDTLVEKYAVAYEAVEAARVRWQKERGNTPHSAHALLAMERPDLFAFAECLAVLIGAGGELSNFLLEVATCKQPNEPHYLMQQRKSPHSRQAELYRFY